MVDEIYVRALRALARREHSTEELRQILQRSTSDAVHVDEVLVQLIAEGALSDARFAASMIRYRASQGKGPLFICDELRKKGVAASIIEEAMVASEKTWGACAVEVRVEKFGDALPRTFVEVSKQKRFLQQRGFSMQQINAVFAGEYDASCSD